MMVCNTFRMSLRSVSRSSNLFRVKAPYKKCIWWGVKVENNMRNARKYASNMAEEKLISIFSRVTLITSTQLEQSGVH